MPRAALEPEWPRCYHTLRPAVQPLELCVTLSLAVRAAGDTGVTFLSEELPIGTRDFLEAGCSAELLAAQSRSVWGLRVQERGPCDLSRGPLSVVIPGPGPTCSRCGLMGRIQGARDLTFSLAGHRGLGSHWGCAQLNPEAFFT